MCRRSEARAAQDAAAEQLARACATRFCSEHLRDPATLKHLPPPPGNFAGLLDRLREVPLRRRSAS